MATLTYRQFEKLVELFKDTPSEQVQAMFASGCLTDVRDANYDGFTPEKRDEVRQPLGLKPLIEVKPIPAPFQFKVRKTIKLGLHKTSAEYRKALKKAGVDIGVYAGKILDEQTPIAETETEVDLVVVTPRELGFRKEPTFTQICDKAIEKGLQRCPREVGPALRLAYPEQPLNEWLRVAMEPVADSGGGLGVFGVGRVDGVRWLGASYFCPQGAWGLDAQFVFVRPRK